MGKVLFPPSRQKAGAGAPRCSLRWQQAGGITSLCGPLVVEERGLQLHQDPEFSQIAVPHPTSS